MKMRYLHLDLKGNVPQNMETFRKWLNWFKKCGFGGLVMEYDCRVAWETWQGAGTSLYSKEAVVDLVKYAESLGFEVVPLIQMHGHLEWILREEKYAWLRENGVYNELCPQLPESKELMRKWIDEVAAMHPNTKMIHLGCDETWALGTCEKCQAKLDERGKMGIYVDHASAMCRYAVEKGLTPLIWDDMFCHDHGISTRYLKDFPEETILVHWKYGNNTRDSLDLIALSGRRVWGASAIRCSYWYHHWHAHNNVGARLSNLAEWEETANSFDPPMTVIHTTWGRPNNLWNLYGPWEGVIAPFIAAGDPERWAKHPWRHFIESVENSLRGHELPRHPEKLESLAADALLLSAEDEMEERGKRFFNLALRFEALLEEIEIHQKTVRCLDVLAKFRAGDPKRELNMKNSAAKIRKKRDAWVQDLKTFWEEGCISDYEEYLETHLAALDV